nr:MAG TPA: hypothetical protein [Caudoviricetes sp.]
MQNGFVQTAKLNLIVNFVSNLIGLRRFITQRPHYLIKKIVNLTFLESQALIEECGDIK